MAHDCLKFNVTIFAIKENFWTSSNCSQVGVKSLFAEKNYNFWIVRLIYLPIQYTSGTHPTYPIPIQALFTHKNSSNKTIHIKTMFPSNLFILSWYLRIMYSLCTVPFVLYLHPSPVEFLSIIVVSQKSHL